MRRKSFRLLAMCTKAKSNATTYIADIYNDIQTTVENKR